MGGLLLNAGGDYVQPSTRAGADDAVVGGGVETHGDRVRRRGCCHGLHPSPTTGLRASHVRIGSRCEHRVRRQPPTPSLRAAIRRRGARLPQRAGVNAGDPQPVAAPIIDVHAHMNFDELLGQDHVDGGHEEAERLGALRHARQRDGVDARSVHAVLKCRGRESLGPVHHLDGECRERREATQHAGAQERPQEVVWREPFDAGNQDAEQRPDVAAIWERPPAHGAHPTNSKQSGRAGEAGYGPAAGEGGPEANPPNAGVDGKKEPT